MKALFISLVFNLLFIPSIGISQTSSRIVAESEAHKLMGAYQMWEVLLPDSIIWNPETLTVTYTPKQLSSDSFAEEQTIIKLKELLEADTSTTTIPYSFGRNLVQSYYLSSDDLKIIDTLISKQYPDNMNTGYRIYMALQPYFCRDFEDVRSHVYVGPSIKIQGALDTLYTPLPIYDSIISGSDKEFVEVLLDLTLPCPKGCGVEFGTQIPDVTDPCLHPTEGTKED